MQQILISKWSNKKSKNNSKLLHNSKKGITFAVAIEKTWWN